MGTRTAAILCAIVLGALFAAALVFVVTYNQRPQQLVGGQPMRYWLQCLDSDNPELRRNAQNSLPQFGAEAVPPLIERLDSAQPQTASAAKGALQTIGPAAVGELGDCLRNGSTTRRIAAIELLQGLGPKSAPAIQQVADLLDDAQAGHAAAEYFVQCGAGPEAVAAAARVMEGTDRQRRLDAIRVLDHAQGDSRSGDLLVLGLKSTDSAVREAAYAALCQFPTPPDEAINFMVDRLTSLQTRSIAYAALLKAGAPALGPLGRLSRNGDEGVRLDAIKLIREILARDGGELTPLQPFLDDISPMVRDTARRSYASLQSNRPMRLAGQNKPLSSDLPQAIPAAMEQNGPAPASDIAPFPKRSSPPPAAAAEARPPPPPPKPDPPKLDRAAVDAALGRLYDADEKVRKHAEEELRSLPLAGDPDLLSLHPASEPAERLRRLRLLPFVEDWRKYDLMITGTHEEDLGLRRAAVAAMGRSLQSPRIVHRLIVTLQQDSSPAIRADAATALAPVNKMPGVREALAAAVNDPDPTVAAAAKAALEGGPLRGY